jgi:peptidyl-prolyl cis-trans isomerase C
MAFRPRSLVLIVAALVGFGTSVACGACNESALEKPTLADASASGKNPLTPELAAKPLATVGDRVITLGEFAATLDRIDQFERLRYQSVERRRALLDEIINAELLAAEARKRGLDKDPEVKERIRQILREDVVRRMRSELPTSSEITEADVQAYYDKHRDEFREPERRRVSHIVMTDKAKALRVLEQAKKASPTDWGKLVRENSLDKPASGVPTGPLELAGDLGLCSPPGQDRGDNPRVPEALRKAVFQVSAVGGVFDGLVEESGKFHIVRMTGKNDARDRSVKEADRVIRGAIFQQRMEAAEKKYQEELKQRFPVKIDEKALEKVEVPSTATSAPKGPNAPAPQPNP